MISMCWKWKLIGMLGVAAIYGAVLLATVLIDAAAEASE